MHNIPGGCVTVLAIRRIDAFSSSWEQDNKIKQGGSKSIEVIKGGSKL